MSNQYSQGATPRDYSLGQRTTGFQRPVAKKFTPTLAKKQHNLTDAAGRWTSVVTISIKPATQLWPAPALNVQIANGNGSAFQRVGDLTDLADFAVFLMQCCEDLKPIWDDAIVKGTALENIQKEVNERAEQFAQMMNAMGGEPTQPPNDYEVDGEFIDANRG